MLGRSLPVNLDGTFLDLPKDGKVTFFGFTYFERTFFGLVVLQGRFGRFPLKLDKDRNGSLSKTSDNGPI